MDREHLVPVGVWSKHLVPEPVLSEVEVHIGFSR
jgi:hypothetical protein